MEKAAELSRTEPVPPHCVMLDAKKHRKTPMILI